MKKRVRVYKAGGATEGAGAYVNRTAQFMNRVQEGGNMAEAQYPMEQQYMQPVQPVQQQVDPKQQLLSVISQALEEGEEPQIIYEALLKQLKDQINPEELSKMISSVVDSFNEKRIPKPQDDLAAETAPEYSGMQEQIIDENWLPSAEIAQSQPSANQMMNDQMMNEDLDESYLYDDELVEAKKGGQISKKKFVSNVMKLAKKQMGDAGQPEQPKVTKATITDNALGDRARIKEEFMSGLKKASNESSLKKQAEEQYEAMIQEQQQMNQYGGFVDGNLTRFSKGGIQKYQTQGETDSETVDETVENTDAAEARRIQAERDKYIDQQINNQRRINSGIIGKTSTGQNIYPGLFDKKMKGRRNWRDLIPFNRGVEYQGSWAQASNARDMEGNPYTGGINYNDATQTKVTKASRRGRPQEWTTTYGTNIVPGVALENYEAPTMYRGSDGMMNQLGNQQMPMIDAPVNSRGRINRRDAENMTVEQRRDAIDAGYKVPDEGNIFERMKWKTQQGIQGNDTGGTNVFQNMWNKVRQGRPEQRQEGGNLSRAQMGLETCQPGYFKGADGVCRDFQGNPSFDINENVGSSLNSQVENPFLMKNITNNFTNENYKPGITMGEDGNYQNDGLITQNDRDNQGEADVDYEKKDMYNIDPEAALQKFNAVANFGIGQLEKIGEQPREKWLRDQTNAESFTPVTRQKKVGDWGQQGNFRPNEQGFRGVSQKGGQIGDEMYMSEQDIEDFINSGGELEFI